MVVPTTAVPTPSTPLAERIIPAGSAAPDGSTEKTTFATTPASKVLAYAPDSIFHFFYPNLLNRKRSSHLSFPFKILNYEFLK